MGPEENHDFTFYLKPLAYMTPSIKKVIFNSPATIVFWADGTKTVVKVQGGDRWDPEKGLAMAMCKKFFGLKKFYKAFDPAFDKYIEKESPLEKFNKAIKEIGR